MGSRSQLEQSRHDLARSEESLTRAQLDYINKMRRRYHEEQIWQDQWRVLGTYGTWTLIVLNSCVFLVSQYFLRQRETERMETIKQIVRGENDKILHQQKQEQQGECPEETKGGSQTQRVENFVTENRAAGMPVSTKDTKEIISSNKE